ncbi:Eukaryotic translation initiation factor 4 gamma [Rhizoctonia solani]|uniref:Eukaryotic translation initiation factor 4 gamma n=1 Tax=Rhizoctonia solani TaxID=456999 RepID=A0A0K6G7E4_9AGAM|nr:Eukaryotic translation initiation factor 4 gamma [Rhizoctonia solani]
MGVCTERPVSLAPLDLFGLEPREEVPGHPQDRRPRGHRGKGMNLSPQHSTSLGLGPGLSRPGFSIGSSPPSSPPGNSQSRFEASNAARLNSVPFAGGNVAGGPRQAKRTRSQRGRNRPDKLSASGLQVPGNQSADLEPVAPLERSENRWIARSTLQAPQPTEERQLVDNKVKALLNKLTTEKFDLISDQIIGWANRSEREEDGATLKQVVELILEQVKEDIIFSETYARLCHKMGERISPSIQDRAFQTSGGQPITGGALFRKYLVAGCREDFDYSWSAEKLFAPLATFPLKFGEDGAAGVVSKGKGKELMEFDEYYAVAKARRRSLGLTRFIGELHKSQILTERVMHEYIKKLVRNTVNSKEEDIEVLCKLLVTVGQSLDSSKKKNQMDTYFVRIQEIVNGGQLSPRIRFTLLGVIELRERNWQPRRSVSRPISSPQPLGRNELGRRPPTRGRARRGENPNNTTEPDGWNVSGGAGTSRPSARAGDLSQFGKISKPTGIQFGPSSVFNKREANNTRGSSIAHAGGANMFSAVADGPSAPVGLGAFPTGARTAERKGRNSLPKTKPDESEVH